MNSVNHSVSESKSSLLSSSGEQAQTLIKEEALDLGCVQLDCKTEYLDFEDKSFIQPISHSTASNFWEEKELATEMKFKCKSEDDYNKEKLELLSKNSFNFEETFNTNTVRNYEILNDFHIKEEVSSALSEDNSNKKYEEFLKHDVKDKVEFKFFEQIKGQIRPYRLNKNPSVTNPTSRGKIR